jgi:hypothetical protein
LGGLTGRLRYIAAMSIRDSSAIATVAILSLCVFSFWAGLFAGVWSESKPPKKPCGYVWSLNGDPAMFASYPITDEWRPVYFAD